MGLDVNPLKLERYFVVRRNCWRVNEAVTEIGSAERDLNEINTRDS